jgi:hypothetical protein
MMGRNGFNTLSISINIRMDIAYIAWFHNVTMYFTTYNYNSGGGGDNNNRSVEGVIMRLFE